MNHQNRDMLVFVATSALAAVTFIGTPARAQDSSRPTSSASSSSTEQWIHVRVEDRKDKGETVRVNVPVDIAVKVLPAINKNQLHNGKVSIDDAHLRDVDLRTMLDAIRTSKDGEYVTVHSNHDNVRIAKSNGYLYVHVTEDSSPHPSATKDKDAKEIVNLGPESKVEIKIPMKVVDALFSAGKDELDIVAGLRALSSSGDTELVSVKDADSTVHIWIDSKNVSD